MIKKLILFLILSNMLFGKSEIDFKKQKVIEKSIKKEKIRLEENKIRNKVVEIALSKLNSPYVWGAIGNKSFDCSSYTQYVYEKLGIKIPRLSYDQSQYKEKSNKIQKGDLLFFDTLGKNRISHVGIYVGNNKFIHASSKYKKVVISELKGYYRKNFKWAISII